jgi:hypothetical protein
MFFFEKQNQTTFASAVADLAGPSRDGRISVSGFFFAKKKTFLPKPPKNWHSAPALTDAPTPWPILAFEMTWWGTVHAPGNGSTLQTVNAAFPGHPIHVFAEPAHVTELARNPVLSGSPEVRFHPVKVSQRFLGRPGVVSLRRMARELVTIFRALRLVKRGQSCLILLLSATSTAVFAAAWLTAGRSGMVAVQVGLHGNIHDANAQPSRNPLLRALDTRAALARAFGGRVRPLVLESAIRDELAKRHPAAAARTDVLPLPINIAEFEELGTAAEPPPPLRVGFVGQATEAKGIGIFLSLARAMRARHGDRVAFHVIGRAQPGTDVSIFAPLEETPSEEHLPRAEFVRRIARLHYVLLPFRPGYYELAASGALIDAVTWLKPVLAMPVGFVEALFAEAGDIGHLCAGEDDLLGTLETLVTAPDPARYAAQVEALRRARAARLPDAVAPAYARMVQANFPFLANAG